MVLLRALVARFWRDPYRGELVSLGHRAPRPLAAAALCRDRHSRCRHRFAALGLRVRTGVVRAVRRVPLSALRHGDLRRRHARIAAGDRAMARAGRGNGAGRDRALRRFLRRTPADQGDRDDGEPPCGDLQRPGTAAHVDRRARRIRGRRALSRMESAVGAASDDRRAGAAHVRPDRRLGADARSAAAPTMSCIRAAATMRRFRSMPTRRRPAAWRGSGPTAIRQVR